MRVMSPVVVEAQHVQKFHGRHHVLKDVTFSARQGELVGIVGENGAGKTTLLKLLVGLDAPSAGRIAITGRLGYCPQDSLVFERLTVAENLDYFATAYGIDDYRSTDRIAWLRLDGYRSTLVSHLSAGTKQKVNLAVALIHGPDLLVLDEPYSAFDWETYLLFWECAAALRSQGKTILIVSHLIYDRSRFDQLLTLQDGVLACV